MDKADIIFFQNHFKEVEKRNPTITEVKMVDTYWSDHCRHTTFGTVLESVTIDDPEVEEAFNKMPFLVQGPVTEPRVNSIRFRGNTEISIPVGNVFSEIIGTICLISQYGCFIRFQINVIQNVFRNDLIMNIAGRKLNVDRISQCIHHRVNLCVSAATSDPNALIFLIFLAFFVSFWAVFGAVRISLFLHLHLPYGL